MIKAIIFDFGNVICHFTNDIFRQRIANLSGKTKEEIKKLIYEDSDIIQKSEMGQITLEEFYEELSEICEINVSYDELKTIYSTDKFTRVEGTKELIEKLRKNYKIGLISNISEWNWDHAVQIAPEVLTFETITKSFEVRAMKPSPIIFEDALKKLNLKAEECVYIDDIEEYVEAAKNMGFRAFQFTTAAQLETDLKSIGVEI
jgi:glucose-1-phosphatase